MPVKFVATCVDEKIKEKFKEMCKEEGVSQYEKLAELIEAYVESLKALEEYKKNIVKIIK